MQPVPHAHFAPGLPTSITKKWPRVQPSSWPRAEGRVMNKDPQPQVWTPPLHLVVIKPAFFPSLWDKPASSDSWWRPRGLLHLLLQWVVQSQSTDTVKGRNEWNLMSEMSQEKPEKNNLRLKTTLQISHCIPRLRHTHVEEGQLLMVAHVKHLCRCTTFREEGWMEESCCSWGSGGFKHFREPGRQAWEGLMQWIFETRVLLLRWTQNVNSCNSTPLKT